MGRFKHSAKRYTSLGEVVMLVLIAVATFWLAGAFHDRGVPSKWVTAVMGTAVPFGFVVYMHRKWLTRGTFWTALVIWLLAHCILVFVFFQFVLRDFSRFSPLLWSPAMILEPFGLLVAIAKIENKLGLDLKGKPVRLTF